MRCARVLSVIGPIGPHSAAQFPYFYMPMPLFRTEIRETGLPTALGPGRAPKSKPWQADDVSASVIDLTPILQLYMALRPRNVT